MNKPELTKYIGIAIIFLLSLGLCGFILSFSYNVSKSALSITEENMDEIRHLALINKKKIDNIKLEKYTDGLENTLKEKEKGNEYIFFNCKPVNNYDDVLDNFNYSLSVASGSSVVQGNYMCEIAINNTDCSKSLYLNHDKYAYIESCPENKTPDTLLMEIPKKIGAPTGIDLKNGCLIEI